MIGNRLFFGLATAALVFLQFTDCMAAMTPDQQTMKCCRSMQCTHAAQSHDCCKKMASEESPNLLAAAQVSLDSPAVVLSESLMSFEIVGESFSRRAVESPQHSPPDLYTLYASLLI